VPDRESYDLLIVGGGPAGLAAAAQATAVGLSVGIVDERATLGGQIYKQFGPGFEVHDPDAVGPEYARGRRLIDAAVAGAARVLLRTAAVSLREGTAVLVTDGERARAVTARRVLLAPGAHDRPVAFPGWTLPGVLTAGGAQTLVKTQRVLPGERMVFAGSGPLALAFPAQLQGYGADIALVCEAGPAPRPGDVARMLRAAPGNVDLLRDALAYRWRLLRARVPLRYRRIVVSAEGEGRVESVTHAAVDDDWRAVPGTEETVAADTLCLGYGFTGSVELLRLAGCGMDYDEDRGGPVAIVDDWMRTTAPGVLAAGDGIGVEGVHVATAEGRLAALGAAQDLGLLEPGRAAEIAAPLRRRLRRRRAFRAALERLHRVGPGIYELTTPETVVCRCEEVRRADLDAVAHASADINVIKGLTRAGMGLCQGRNCQRQVAALIAARHGGHIADVPMATPRMPVRPVPLAAVADEAIDDLGFFHDA
jgi:thioredoxin reductase